MSLGKIYGVGIGPGDSDLITLKGYRLLQSCPVLAWPAPEEGESLARRIAAPHIPADVHEIPIRMPLTGEALDGVYDAAATEIGAQAAQGKDCTILCEGDPFFYGSFMYMYQRLHQRFEVEVVPGVSSLTAVSGRLGLPLVGKNDRLVVLPAPCTDLELEQALEHSEAAAIVKLGRHAERVRALLARLRLLEHASYIRHATMPTEEMMPFADLEGPAPYFSMVVVHKRRQACYRRAWL